MQHLGKFLARSLLGIESQLHIVVRHELPALTTEFAKGRVTGRVEPKPDLDLAIEGRNQIVGQDANLILVLRNHVSDAGIPDDQSHFVTSRNVDGLTKQFPALDGHKVR